jgi:hypothetical protein
LAKEESGKPKRVLQLLKPRDMSRTTKMKNEVSAKALIGGS